MNDLQLAALAFAIVAVLVLLAVARWIGEGIPEQLHAQAPFDPAKTAGGCAGKSRGAYAAPVTYISDDDGSATPDEWPGAR